MSAIDAPEPLRVPPPSPVAKQRRVERERRDDERSQHEHERRERDDGEQPPDDGAPHVDVRA